MITITEIWLLLFILFVVCVHVGVVGWIVYLEYDSRRLTKAVGTLVLQEAEKIRRLVSISSS